MTDRSKRPVGYRPAETPQTYTQYMRFEGKKTLAELIEQVREKGFSPEEVTVAGGHVTFAYKKTETAEEVEKRLARVDAGWERHKEWLARHYAEVFGDNG